MKSKVINPKVVKGGAAVPLGDNFYYMTGRKHKDGGIEIGKNPSTGLEVEDGEVMHMTNKEVKVFSSVPFLNGISPAEKVLNGDNSNKVFTQQQKFKKTNGINDDGTIKKNGGKIMNRNKYLAGGTPKKKTPKVLPSIATRGPISPINDSDYNTFKDGIDGELNTTDPIINPINGTPPNRFNRIVGDIKLAGQRGVEAVDNFYSERPGALGDTIGVASNIVGGLISNRANNKMLDKLKYSNQPVARQATKLKTKININPQLDKMRETLASYERDIDNNTASSRVALARKQRGRLANTLQTNEIFGNKENMETELQNQDSINQQRVANANTEDYNRWSEGKAAFNNAVAEKRSENTVGLIETLNAGVQDVISRGEKRSATRENMLAMAAASPNVNPRILKDLGVKSITDKMVSDWDKANSKQKKKSKGK